MALPYFDPFDGDTYEPATVKPRLQSLDWYQIHSLYRQSYNGGGVHSQVLVQKFSPDGKIDETRNQQILAFPFSTIDYQYQYTTLTTLS